MAKAGYFWTRPRKANAVRVILYTGVGAVGMASMLEQRSVEGFAFIIIVLSVIAAIYRCRILAKGWRECEMHPPLWPIIEKLDKAGYGYDPTTKEWFRGIDISDGVAVSRGKAMRDARLSGLEMDFYTIYSLLED